MKTRPNHAFTLLELLVVIAIIGVLAALLLPALSKALAASQRAACISRSKQWGFAMEYFLADYDEFMPRENVTSSINEWSDALLNTSISSTGVWYNVLPQGYMDCKPVSEYAALSTDQMEFYDRASMFHCPAARFTVNPAGYPQFSMAMNSKLISTENPWIRKALIQEPSRTPYFIESGVPGERKFYDKQSNYNGQPHAFASRFSGRHGGYGVIAFADGHAETFHGSKVVEIRPTSPSPGKAIFPPGEVIWCADPSVNPNF